MSQGDPRIEKLLQLGYRLEDIQVLPDGEVIIHPHDESKNTANAVSRATRGQRLQRLSDERAKILADLTSAANSPEVVSKACQRLTDIDEKIKTITAED